MKNNFFKITELWAYVAVDEKDNCEGIVSAYVPNIPGANASGIMPLICADKARLKSCRPIAIHIAKQSKTKIKVLKFTQREEIEEIDYVQS